MPTSLGGAHLTPRSLVQPSLDQCVLAVLAKVLLRKRPEFGDEPHCGLYTTYHVFVLGHDRVDPDCGLCSCSVEVVETVT